MKNKMTDLLPDDSARRVLRDFPSFNTYGTAHDFIALHGKVIRAALKVLEKVQDTPEREGFDRWDDGYNTCIEQLKDISNNADLVSTPNKPAEVEPTVITVPDDEDPAEAAYWRFDARRKGYKPYLHVGERMAFKDEYRAALATGKGGDDKPAAYWARYNDGSGEIYEDKDRAEAYVEAYAERATLKCTVIPVYTKPQPASPAQIDARKLEEALERIEVALQFYADRFNNARGSQIQANIGLGAVDIIRAHLSKLLDRGN